MEPDRVRATRRGEVVHHALGYLSAPATETRIERAVMSALAVLDLDPAEWRIKQDFVDPLKRILNLPEFARWFGKDVASLTEAEIMDDAGDVVRPDRIVIAARGAGSTGGQGVDVIDFKAGLREAAHGEQITKYVKLLRAVFPGRRVTAFLAYIDEPAVVEIK
jgi:hypothetical protein